ncbi:MAG: hypothetical protein RJQ14_11660 [Marinoscillum sp.]
MGRLSSLASLIFVLLIPDYASAQERSQGQIVFNQPKYLAEDTAFFSMRIWDSAVSQQGKQIFVLDLVDQQRKSVKQIQFNVFNGAGENQIILPEKLPAGTYAAEVRSIRSPERVFVKHITVVDNKVITGNSRLLQGQSNDGVNCQLKLSKQYFGQRDTVTAVLTVTDQEGAPVGGNFSVSVLDARLFDSRALHQTSTVTYGNAQRSSGITGNRLTRFGTAYYADQMKPLPDSTELLFYLQNSNMLYQVITIKNGAFKLEMLDIDGEDELYYVAQLPGKEKRLLRTIHIDWEKSKFEHQLPMPFIEQDMPDPYAEFTRKKRLINLSYGFYTQDPKLTELTKSVIMDPVVPDQTFKIQDYIIFPTMGELINAVINSLFYGKSGGKEVVRVRYLQPVEAIDDPLYLIDGIATMNTDFFLSIEPLDIVSLKTVRDPRKLIRFGALGRNGIVIVHTRFGNLRETINQDNVVKGLNRPMSYQNSLKKDGVPDFRSTIYWSPATTLTTQGRSTVTFQTTDNAGTMLILIEGMTADGRQFALTKTIEVSSKQTH